MYFVISTLHCVHCTGSKFSSRCLSFVCILFAFAGCNL